MLNLQSENATQVSVSNDSTFTYALWEPFTSPMDKIWTLSSGDGPKTVYVLFKSSDGNLSNVVEATIELKSSGCGITPPIVPPIEPPVVLPPIVPPVEPPVVLLPIVPPVVTPGVSGGQPRTNPEKLSEVGENCEKIDCSKLVLKPYIINPAYAIFYNPKLQTIYFDNSPYVKVKNLSRFQQIVYFEDKIDFDYNDSVFKLDWQNCQTNLSLTMLDHDALWHHQVWVKIYYDNKLISDALLWPDDSMVPLNSAQNFDMCQLIWTNK
jgi:hypothetical protein